MTNLISPLNINHRYLIMRIRPMMMNNLKRKNNNTEGRNRNLRWGRSRRSRTELIQASHPNQRTSRRRSR
jgi:hypothetical protein